MKITKSLIFGIDNVTLYMKIGPKICHLKVLGKHLSLIFVSYSIKKSIK